MQVFCELADLWIGDYLLKPHVLAPGREKPLGHEQ